MKYLIDTHAFMWFNEGSAELSPTAKALIEDAKNEIFLSIASLWEISIKNALGKLNISKGYDTVIDDVIANDMEVLSINFAHTAMQNKLPFHHKDPFDRIIVSQAIVENLDLISKDDILDEYFIGAKVRRLW